MLGSENKQTILNDDFKEIGTCSKAINIKSIDIVINICDDKEILINRLIKRAEDSGRSDDTKEVIVNRQNVYLELTAPLLEFYKNEVINVDGDGTIEEVTQRVLAAIQ